MTYSVKLTRALVDAAMGRLPADLIIRNGKNYYGQDIERCIAETPGLIEGGAVVFGIDELASARVCFAQSLSLAQLLSLAARTSDGASSASI